MGELAEEKNGRRNGISFLAATGLVRSNYRGLSHGEGSVG